MAQKICLAFRCPERSKCGHKGCHAERADCHVPCSNSGNHARCVTVSSDDMSDWVMIVAGALFASLVISAIIHLFNI